MLEAKLVDEFFHLLAALVPGNRLRFQHREDVFLYCELAKDRSFLREIADAILARPQIHGNVSDVLTAVQHAASVRGNQTYNGVKSSSLAGPVRS